MCFRALIRMAMLSSEHPLYLLIRRNITYRTKRHHTLLHTLLSLYNLDISVVEKILSFTYNLE
jgi:hypothetical protein